MSSGYHDACSNKVNTKRFNTNAQLLASQFLNTHSFILDVNPKSKKANGIRGHESGVVLNDRPEVESHLLRPRIESTAANF
jgi:hypothetical protein